MDTVSPRLRRLLATALLGFLVLNSSSAQFPIEVGPECTPNVTVEDHPLDPTVDDPLTVQECSPRVLVDDGSTSTDTQCDDVTCAFVRIDDGVDASNILDTVPSAASPDVLTWGGSQVWTAGGDGAGSGLDADTVDGKDSTEFLAATGKATDADRLDGIDGSGYVQGGQSDLHIIHGRVSPSGVILGGTGFTVNKFRTGGYTINFDTSFVSSPTITGILENSGTNGQVVVEAIAAGSAQLGTSNASGSSIDSSFHFNAIGQI